MHTLDQAKHYVQEYVDGVREQSKQETYCETITGKELWLRKPHEFVFWCRTVPNHSNFFFFFQAEDGIRDHCVTGVQTCALPICNTVILKPSSDSPTIAAKFVELLEEAGMPDGVVNFCPGAGASFGNAVVAHPKTRYIAFTGSREVGLDINKRAAEKPEGQLWIKRTILEMGGKDAIIVDADADIDSAVEGVAVSAFGFQGQKCSACSRAIIDERIYDKFLEKLKTRVEKITVGHPAENGY